MPIVCAMTQENLQRNDLIHLFDLCSNQNYGSFPQKDDLLTPSSDEGYSSLGSNSDSDNPIDVLKKYEDLLTPSNDEGFSSLSSSSDSNHSNGSFMQSYTEAQRRTSGAQYPNNFKRQLSHSESSDGNPPRISKLLAEVSQRTEELLRENAQTLQTPENNQATATAICELFYHRGLYENHFVAGEDIVSVLKFLAGVALHKNIINEKQEKRVNILSTAVAKECGFSTYVSIYPLVCIPLQSKIFNKSANHHHPSGQIFLSKLLRLQKNSKSPAVYLDETGRVYTSTSDWVRTNHFLPSLVYYPQKIIIDDDIQRLPFRLREVTTPSCQTSKKALKAVDVIIGLSAVTAGAVCIATGGLALPIAGAAQLVASLYLGARSTAAIVDNQRHRPKSHNK